MTVKADASLLRSESSGLGHVIDNTKIVELPTASQLAALLANDWTVTGIVTLQSGMPVAVTQTTNNNAFAGFGTQRPNLVGDPTLSDDERSVNRWFDTSAFAPAPRSPSARALGTLSAVLAIEIWIWR